MKTQLHALWARLPASRRALAIGTGVAAMAAVLAVAWWIQRPLHRPPFTNGSPRDAGPIVHALPVRGDDGGRAGLLPPERLAYERALQAGLGRTIAQLGGVESARVHLAIPDRAGRASASVVVKLAAGRVLERAQVDGIVHLVASSVEGLEPDGVTVLDRSGRLLTAERPAAEGDESSSPLAMQLAVEREIADRVETMLGAVVGPNGAIARVAATLDFARVERTEETYDPDRTALRSQHATRDSERRDDSQTYEVSKLVSRTVAPGGGLKQLSVAVLVDGVYSEQNGTRVFTPRSPEEMGRLRELVKGAVGFSEGRGDKIEVVCVPFHTEPVPPGESVLRTVAVSIPAVFLRLLAVAFVVVVLLYVVRPLVLAVATRPAPSAVERPAAALGVEGAGTELTRENVALTRANPERAAQLVREWLRRD
ncbi:MAG TPA: flagellar M-ring protein FliF C-terminal domain-containing protein [Candidatus Binatia bacterium]|nr:flagellar M-ring protein FliF C-terminal domain-containing protein [Candidatus Binatia bacterium]